MAVRCRLNKPNWHWKSKNCASKQLTRIIWTYSIECPYACAEGLKWRIAYWTNNFIYSLLHEEKIDLAADMYEARQHWYWWERTRHFIFFGDTERKITDAERVWEEAQAKLKSRKSRSGVQKWNPFHRAEQDVEQFVGGNVSQIFGFYQVLSYPYPDLLTLICGFSLPVHHDQQFYHEQSLDNTCHCPFLFGPPRTRGCPEDGQDYRGWFCWIGW